MTDRETTTKRDTPEESPEEHRTRKSAREVTEWENAFAEAKKQKKQKVSRAVRAEKTTVRPPKV